MNDTHVPSRTRTKRAFLSIIAAIALLASNSTRAVGQEDAVGRTPPRLSYLDGEASFWRPGADDWSEAQVNLPLAPGDQLYTADRSNLELQVGARAYLRAAENTQFGLENQEPDFLQLRLAGGQVALDLRSLTPGHTIELDTPHAAFTIERSGYYRAIVSEDATTFVVRRGGSALVTPAGGANAIVSGNEQAVIRGADNPSMEIFAAGDLDDWDGWNYGRTDQLYASTSSRYVPEDVYGTQELDNYGSWRNVPTYGSVWVPRAVATGWAPYTEGRWIWDPYYQWTWLSSEPWGWAPFHYGRWVYYDDYWAWAPGPRLRAAVYAPALVAFFGGGGFSVGVSVGVPIAPIGWVSLSWGEPLYPWWGPVGFCDRPYWGGWGGQRVVINKTKIVNKTKIINVDGYHNSRHRNGMVVVKGDRFGRGDVRSGRIDRFDRENFRPIDSKGGVKPTRESLRPRDSGGKRPPRDVADRPVVATRSPRDNSSRLRAAGLTADAPSPSHVRLVEAPRRGHVSTTSQPHAGRPDTVDRRRSTDVDNRASRATVPNPRMEKQAQSPPNRQRRGERPQDGAAPPPSPRPRSDSQQPRVDRQQRQSPPDRPQRGATLPRTSSPPSSDEVAPAAPAKQPRAERESRQVAPVPARRSRVDRQPERVPHQEAPSAPALRSRNERAPQPAAREAAPSAPQPHSEPRYEQRQQRPEMPAPRPQTQVAPPRDSRRAAPAMQSRQDSGRPQSFSAMPQSRPQRQQRVERSQPQVSRPQRSEQSVPNRPQAERPARSGASESRQSRRSSNSGPEAN